MPEMPIPIVKLVPDHRPFNRAMREARRLTQMAAEKYAVEPSAGLERFLSLLSVMPKELSRIESHVCRADGAHKTVVLFHPGKWLEDVIAAGRAFDSHIAGQAGRHEGSTSLVVGNSKVERVGESTDSEVRALSGDAPDTEGR